MQESNADQRRYAVIGAGAGVFGMHQSALQLPFVQLVGVSDINPTTGQQRADKMNCTFYNDYHQMLAEERPDVVVIMTPHPLHARIAIECLESGSHVLVEKPMAVQVSEADAMIEVAQRHKRILGTVFQHRFRSDIQTVRKLIQDGRLGEIQHVEMTVNWTRTAAYFQNVPWRGTWKGEGGGVLMNQSAHNLDVLCHLIGLPARVFGWTRRMIHNIETEDTIQAVLEWPNGALGSLHISTAEVDPFQQFKIIGTRGSIEIRGDKLVHYELDSDLRDFVVANSDPFASPALHKVAPEMVQSAGNHHSVYRAFHRAILGEAPFTSAGAEGRMELELANALIYSSHSRSEVEFPLDRQKYAELLDALRSGTWQAEE